MARTFASASAEKVDLSLGAGASLSGAVTLAAICKASSDGASKTVFCIGSTSSTSRRLRLNSSNLIGMLTNNTALTAATLTLVAADGWCLIAATKAAGTTAIRAHKFKFSTNTWTHENGSATAADSTPSGASAIGNGLGASTQPWNGDVALCGAWTSVLSDAEIETLAYSLTAWRSNATTLNGLWTLDQAATSIKVWDLTGNGANESGLTGTSVATSAVPVWNRGATPTRVLRAPAVVAGTALPFMPPRVRPVLIRAR